VKIPFSSPFTGSNTVTLPQFGQEVTACSVFATSTFVKRNGTQTWANMRILPAVTTYTCITFGDNLMDPSAEVSMAAVD
jgi:hypothetical protein